MSGDTIYLLVLGLFGTLAAGTIGYVYYTLCREDEDCIWEKNGYVADDKHLSDIAKDLKEEKE